MKADRKGIYVPLPCPGRCNAEPGPTNFGEPVWCGPCSLIARKALRSLPKAYEALSSMMYLSKSPTLDVQRVSGTPTRPSQGPGVDMQDEIFHTIRSWEDDIRQHLKHRAARDMGLRKDTLAGAVRYLNRNFEAALARDPGGKELGLEVSTLLSTALIMVKNGPLRHVLVTPCPFCKMRALMAQEGVAGEHWYTACEKRMGGCGRTFTETEVGWMMDFRIGFSK